MEVTGLNKMKRLLLNMKNLENDVSHVMKMNSAQAPEIMITSAKEVMTKGYWTGNLARLIKSEINNKLTFTLISNAYYSGFVNYGTRYMQAEPFLAISVKRIEDNLRADFGRLIRSY